MEHLLYTKPWVCVCDRCRGNKRVLWLREHVSQMNTVTPALSVEEGAMNSAWGTGDRVRGGDVEKGGKEGAPTWRETRADKARACL